jgi:hypothetical protein
MGPRNKVEDLATLKGLYDKALVELFTTRERLEAATEGIRRLEEKLAQANDVIKRLEAIARMPA